MKLWLIIFILLLLIVSSGCLKPIRVQINFLNKTYTFDFNVSFVNESAVNPPANNSNS